MGPTRDLRAVPLNWFLEPGDVVYAGEQMVNSSIQAAVIYADEVRTGGTVAWICRNPGNIKQSPSLFAEKHGAFKGKISPGPGVTRLCDLPQRTEGTHGRRRPAQGIRACDHQAGDGAVPKNGGGKNDPELYAAILARGLHVNINTKLSRLTNQQVSRMAALIQSIIRSRQRKMAIRCQSHGANAVCEACQGKQLVFTFQLPTFSVPSSDPDSA